jgi:predicted RNA-binding Zn ribbon-like protein
MARFHLFDVTCKVVFAGYNTLMSEWTAHRFSGGVLALDLANTVVWKDDPARRMDRLQNLTDIQDFTDAALQFSDIKLTSARLVAPKSKLEAGKVLALRSAIDDWLRPVALGGTSYSAVPQLMKASWHATRNTPPSHLAHACTLSAMQFFQSDFQQRLNVCPACRWLFLDRSKNKSRRWCDMKVCGNRAKARVHYALTGRSGREVE